MSNQDSLSQLESKLKSILDKAQCPVCWGSIERRPYGRFGISAWRIQWRCLNSECEESTHWNELGEHRGWIGGVNE